MGGLWRVCLQDSTAFPSFPPSLPSQSPMTTRLLSDE